MVVALGVIADEGLGGEAAGVVIDTAADVRTLCARGRGDGSIPAQRVRSHRDHRCTGWWSAIPAGWSFTAAASVPVAFLTAYIALVEIGGLSAGQRVLIHAGAGGVGQAAIQIAAHLGAQVFATAHPSKQQLLADLGVAPITHRVVTDPGFRRRHSGGPAAGRVWTWCSTACSGDFIDASLDLLGRGGCFVEIGKTDIRAARRDRRSPSRRGATTPTTWAARHPNSCSGSGRC